MSDVLKMTYSDMEQLTNAFNKTALDLNEISCNAFRMMTDIQNVTAKDWIKQIENNIQTTEDILSPLDSIASSIGSSWQGDRYEDFVGNLYPEIQRILLSMQEELQNLQNSITVASEQLNDVLNPLVKKIAEQKVECENIAKWINDYMLKHIGIELGYSEEQIDQIRDAGSLQEKMKYSPSLLAAVKIVKEKYDRVQTAANFDELSDYAQSGNPIKQGSSYIYNIHTTKNADGSGDISFTCSNSTKRITEITVYDANGNIVSQEYMKGQEDPSSISGVFVSTWDGLKDMANGKFARYDADFSNSKMDYALHIPAGGYVRVTDDVSLMNVGSYVETKGMESIIDNASDIAGASAPKYGKIGYNIAKGVVVQNAKDELNGVQSSVGDYLWNAGGDAVDTGFEIASEYMGPAGAGLKVIDATLDVNKGLEKEVKIHQEEKTKGNGALYICV